jgi:hypothetical protein
MAPCRTALASALALLIAPVAHAIDWLPINGAASDVTGSVYTTSWLGDEHTGRFGPVAAGLDIPLGVQSGIGHSDSNTSASVFASVENGPPIATNVSLDIGVDKGRLSDPNMQISLYGTATWSANIVNHSGQSRSFYFNVLGIDEPVFPLITQTATLTTTGVPLTALDGGGYSLGLLAPGQGVRLSYTSSLSLAATVGALDDVTRGNVGALFQYAVSPVPEPATAMLWVVGLACIGAFARCRERSGTA